jgi:hypothetical protein
MTEFAILNNRKRALIALIHSVIFLGVALQGFLSPKPGLVHGAGKTGDFVLTAIYVIVSSILTWLVCVSRGTRERLYFVLCVCSASSGLLRTIFGDLTLPAAQYLRVGMLLCAVLVGTTIWRSYSRPLPENVIST